MDSIAGLTDIPPLFEFFARDVQILTDNKRFVKYLFLFVTIEKIHGLHRWPVIQIFDLLM